MITESPVVFHKVVQHNSCAPAVSNIAASLLRQASYCLYSVERTGFVPVLCDRVGKGVAQSFHERHFHSCREYIIQVVSPVILLTRCLPVGAVERRNGLRELQVAAVGCIKRCVRAEPVWAAGTSAAAGTINCCAGKIF